MNLPRLRGPRPGTACHPLGPLVYRVAAEKPGRVRLIAAGVFFGSLGILLLAARLSPDASGSGSHRQLGLPPCSLLTLTGYPCPTCGMTTAFTFTVRGKLGAAFRAQPAGLLLALATIAAFSVSLGVMLSGKVWVVNWYRLPPARLTLIVLAVILFGWVYKLAAGAMSGKLPVTR